MKKLFTLLLFSIIAFTSFAEYDCMALYLSNGEKKIIPVSEACEISINGGVLTIGSLQYDIYNINKYEFVNSGDSGISEVEGNLDGFVFNPEGLIYIPSKLSDEKVRIFSISGVEYAAKTENGTIDLTALKKGIYIISVGTITFKFAKR